MCVERKIYNTPPECWVGCDDPMCPYIHIHTWDVEGHEDESFTSPIDAKRFVEARGEVPVMVGYDGTQ